LSHVTLHSGDQPIDSSPDCFGVAIEHRAPSLVSSLMRLNSKLYMSLVKGLNL
jgi:hypothetical protein